MKILIAHNAYQQRGGEDAVVEAESQLLREAGHEVVLYQRHNDEVAAMGRLALAINTVWSERSHREISELIANSRPDVVHVHNTMPLISPSIYDACVAQGVALVQTLHNFRLACPSGSFLRNGQICEKCLGRPPWPAVLHGCYRGSRTQSAVLASSLGLHRLRGSMTRAVHRWIALSEFGRQKFIDMGLPAERVVVKPNFVADPALSRDSPREGLLYVGRLSTEKGIDTLAEALSLQPNMPLVVAGSGPEESRLRRQPNAQLLGNVPSDAVMRTMASSVAVLIPSVCYEGFPRTLAEAYATGTPIIASRIGALADLVQHGITGLLVPPGNAAELASAMRWALDNPRVMNEMGLRARGRYLAQFTPEHNLPALENIYRQAIDTAKHPRRSLQTRPMAR